MDGAAQAKVELTALEEEMPRGVAATPRLGMDSVMENARNLMAALERSSIIDPLLNAPLEPLLAAMRDLGTVLVQVAPGPDDANPLSLHNRSSQDDEDAMSTSARADSAEAAESLETQHPQNHGHLAAPEVPASPQAIAETSRSAFKATPQFVEELRRLDTAGTDDAGIGAAVHRAMSRPGPYSRNYA